MCTNPDKIHLAINQIGCLLISTWFVMNYIVRASSYQYYIIVYNILYNILNTLLLSVYVYYFIDAISNNNRSIFSTVFVLDGDTGKTNDLLTCIIEK